MTVEKPAEMLEQKSFEEGNNLLKNSKLMLTRRNNSRTEQATISRQLMEQLIEKTIDTTFDKAFRNASIESNHGTPIFNACAIHNRGRSLSMFPFSEWWFCISRMLI